MGASLLALAKSIYLGLMDFINRARRGSAKKEQGE